MKTLLTRWSPVLTGVLLVLTLIGYYLGSSLQLKLSLTDLLPANHPAVVKFEKLTEVVGGVGYFAIVLNAEDGTSHLKVAPQVVEALRKNSLVRSAFYHREQRFFVDRLLYYVDLPKLKDLELNIEKQITRAKRNVFDLGLWGEDNKAEQSQVFDNELSDMAKKSASISPYLISADKRHLLVMVKPSFDSMDLKTTEKLVVETDALLKQILPANVKYEFAERYYTKVVETKMVQNDILILGTLSILLIGLVIFLYVRSFRALCLIFFPVLMGMGITVGVAKLYIGHINIITGFLMGIVSGLGVDYGIHLLLRLRLERTEPSNGDPDPVWRTIASSGHSVFVGAVAAAASFFFLCFSSFRAFSEFGFICGVGITAVFTCLLCSFSFLARFLKQDTAKVRSSPIAMKVDFPVLSSKKLFWGSVAVSVALFIGGTFVRFEYDFDKMLQHSKHMEELGNLVDVIYDRNSSPSAIAVPEKADAIALEKVLKEKYMPKLVAELISGASIVPEHQAEKQQVLQRIEQKIVKLKDRWIETSLNIPAKVVRDWMKAKPFTFADLPSHIQDALRGTNQGGYLFYLYPAMDLNSPQTVKAWANMFIDLESQFPSILSGSDAVVFSDILDLINRDGLIILLVIFVSVGLFIWVNVRKWDDTLLSYLPLLVSLPIGMGLMAIFGIRFNIFNIAIIPTFVAMGIDVPIHIVHRAREVGSGFKAARDLATSINLALVTAAVGFGILIFARAGVLKSLGWIALLGTIAIWWVGLFLLPAIMERIIVRTNRKGTVSKNSFPAEESTRSEGMSV